MFDSKHVYAFDIETDNSAGQGLNPQLSSVTSIALVGEDFGHVFTGSEQGILTAWGDALDELEPGLLCGWNSGFFDLPFLHDRTKIQPWRSASYMELIEQPGLRPKYDYLPGWTTAVTGVWHRAGGSSHSHLDISHAWKSFAAGFGLTPEGKPVVPWSLKPVAEAAGVEMFVIDRTRLHEYSQEDQDLYVMSDATGTRQLVLKTLGLA